MVSGGGAALYTRYQDNLTLKNNIYVGGNGSIALENTTFASSGINNNYYAIMGNGNTFGYASNSGDNFTTWKGWLPSVSSQDSASLAVTVANLNVDNTGNLLSNSPAKGLGANLTSIGISPLNFDKNGKPRPSTGSWDAGAYAYTTQSNLPIPTINFGP
jgi:hypothetical protein